MYYIAYFTDSTTYSGQQGYWTECPDRGLAALHIALPFAIRQRGEDGAVTELPPSTVKLEGFSQYYFARRARTALPIGTGGTAAALHTEELGVVMAGRDEEKDIVVYIEVDLRGNVTTQCLSRATFEDTYHVAETAWRKGVSH